MTAAPGGRSRGEEMEVAGESPATPGLGPSTSTAAAAQPPPPPPPGLPERIVSSSSLSSEISEEDWLIKVTCPGARHQYSRNVQSKKPAKTELLQNLDKEDECASNTSYESLPAVSSLNETGRNILSLKTKPSESWLTQKHLSAMQAVVSGQQYVGDSALTLLERENCFVREVDRYLKHNDLLALRRKEMQYKKWFENVSSPLLRKIQDKVDSQSSEEIEERKRKQLSLYLNYCNKQHGAYLDSYSPSAYDPFSWRSTGIWQISVPPLCDPLLKDVQERYLEEGIIRQCDTGRMYSSKEMSELYKADLPILPLSRQVMNPTEWLKIPSSYVDSEIRQKSRNVRLRDRKGKEPERIQAKERLLASRGSPKTKARDAERNPLSPKQRMASVYSPLASTLLVNSKGTFSAEDAYPTSPL